MSTSPPRPVSVVALLADVPSTGLLGEHQAHRFPLRGGELGERSAEFVDFARHHISQGHRVIALYPKWHAERAQRAVAFARGSLQSDQIGQVSLDISPLALSLIADQVAYLAPYVPPGVAAALATELTGNVLAGAWLKRVNNLSTIPITFKQHVGSYVPKTTFLAFSAPVNRVGRVKKRNPARNIVGRPMEPVQILVARPEGAGIDEFNNQFTPALRPVSLNALPEQPLGATYWGMRKYVEFVAFSGHPEALSNTVRTVRPTPCAWCRELGTAIICPFCGAARQLQAGRPPARKADVPPPPARTTGEHIRPAWVEQPKSEAAPFPLHPGPALPQRRRPSGQQQPRQPGGEQHQHPAGDQQAEQTEQKSKAAPFPLHPGPALPPKRRQAQSGPQQPPSGPHPSMAVSGPNGQPSGPPSGTEPSSEQAETARSPHQQPPPGAAPD
ncbi:hypothetical protein F4561_000970 [Lipingzhangella halophila]|uniref:Uncharacterized protein n=1 Tax=Lipingzhangella halophila TaxID=1783352 RepID=A0A7W7W1Y9_9ACTN|nr:hypothetical protein [Lipingzhangella halophila]MBB4930150.1 hypothetical protein [Lipingzhangella halophila]